jgi:hypothetical protein
MKLTLQQNNYTFSAEDSDDLDVHTLVIHFVQAMRATTWTDKTIKRGLESALTELDEDGYK